MPHTGGDRPVHYPMIRIGTVLGQDDQQSRHALQTEGMPQLAQHPRSIAMTPIEDGVADRICHVRRHE